MEKGRRNAFTRRGLLAGAAVLSGRFAYAGLPVPPDSRLDFRLMRHGSQIGTHAMTFSRDGEVLTVQIAVDVLVKFGPIPLVRYTHRNQEIWQRDRLVGFESRTDRNGKPLHVKARWDGPGLAVEGTGTPRVHRPGECAGDDALEFVHAARPDDRHAGRPAGTPGRVGAARGADTPCLRRADRGGPPG